MRIRSARRAAIVATVFAACLLSCSADTDDTPQGAGTRAAPRSPSAPAPADTGARETPAAPAAAASPGPELVRDAFAGLQATLDDTCTPGAGDCAYFLGRVHEELMGLDAAMKADPKGPGHFPEPLAWIKDLRTALGDDTSTENLEAHRTELIGVRDRINGWMQGHPDDYR
ncbi:hypothetical protein QWJ26_39315 [Streptomyces sp. CSDS2]|uniref:hypothetical protein n=1 Tax=Streptomyces sp. CSDS2 TaxID=3055051 RepID=UPI0025B18DE1|nr:hypothetical protein [Streptomyces sp. CSDS2]MDN3265750.1 hypothetical protein [Streptomyces sp. CSDS2]